MSLASARSAISRRSAASSTNPPGASRRAQSRRSTAAFASRFVSRTERAKATSPASRASSAVKSVSFSRAMRVGLVIGDIGERATRERSLGLDKSVAFEQRPDVGERSAAQDVDDERIGFALVLPGFRACGRDRRADRLQLIELGRVGRFVALSDPELDPPQFVDEVGDLRRIGKRRGRRKHSERGQSQHAPRGGHGLASRTRISMRRFSAARGWDASLR